MNKSNDQSGDQTGDQQGRWRGARTFVVDAKKPESETVTSFILVPEDDMLLASFKPGQILGFKLDLPGQDIPVSPTYTISVRPRHATSTACCRRCSACRCRRGTTIQSCWTRMAKSWPSGAIRRAWRIAVTREKMAAR